MRIEQEYKDRAKAENLALFQVMIDRRKVPIELGGGYKHEQAGCLSLSKAARIMAILQEDN